MMIAKKPVYFLTVLAIVFSSFTAFAGGGDTTSKSKDGGRVNTKSEIDGYIKHHLADSHDFTLFSYTNDAGERKHIGFSLPVIVWTSQGLKTFMSSEFHHNDDGHVVVEKGGVKLAKIHSKIYELNREETAVAFDETHHATNAHKVLDFSITKSVFGMLLVGLLMFFGFRGLASGYKKGPVPTGFARVLEPLVLYVRDEIARPNIGEKHYRKFMGFLLTVFFFIWALNLLGLTPLGFNVTGQIAVTVCLAMFTFFIVQFSGNKDYWKHIFWMPGVPVLMKIVLAPIEVLGMLTKPFSLFVRLFANITAGHSVVMGIAALMILLKAKFGTAGATSISFLLTLFLTLIEVLVAFLQAYIFTMLSSLFIGMAVEEHDHH
ncbi:F0F1 ATP synthase subunit A [Tenacibaculum sp. 1B UA]|uniref:F0F1 ATP synthase subunit A n=1 Tax=unclassified Tenacibaculum TaxID=2635139 RepID=UPI0026E37F93|nr:MULTISPECIES: F0F1 ATP synthase subunit A [unclassified Tenacibaculum]MDO6674467.1 F0F1 ATP synthase subunit A [Tenacibaculum sp. 1_MG-2023]MDX8552222.1 F0F1 ATP synthase subunit A [Tenacibaculum sp. 1B UA]